MASLALLLSAAPSLLIGPARAQTAECFICGQGQVTSTPSEVAYVTGAGVNVTCGEMETSGLDGSVTTEQCSEYRQLAEALCSCVPFNYPCSICGDGRIVTDPEGNITIPDLGVTSCADAEEMGENGELDATQCTDVPALARESCGCEDAPVASPTEVPPAASPTEAPPVAAPTEAPAAPSAASPLSSGLSLILSASLWCAVVLASM
jgi:hypothetical protein